MWPPPERHSQRNGCFHFSVLFGRKKLVELEKATVKFLNIRTPENIAVITLKIEQSGSTIKRPQDVDGMANSVDPDQTAPAGAEEQSDLGPHCLPRPVLKLRIITVVSGQIKTILCVFLINSEAINTAFSDRIAFSEYFLCMPYLSQYNPVYSGLHRHLPLPSSHSQVWK